MQCLCAAMLSPWGLLSAVGVQVFWPGEPGLWSPPLTVMGRWTAKQVLAVCEHPAGNLLLLLSLGSNFSGI